MNVLGFKILDGPRCGDVEKGGITYYGLGSCYKDKIRYRMSVATNKKGVMLAIAMMSTGEWLTAQFDEIDLESEDIFKVIKTVFEAEQRILELTARAERDAITEAYNSLSLLN